MSVVSQTPDSRCLPPAVARSNVWGTITRGRRARRVPAAIAFTQPLGPAGEHIRPSKARIANCVGQGWRFIVRVPSLSLWCWIFGHDDLIKRAPDRMFLECFECGRTTRGWSLRAAAPRRRRRDQDRARRPPSIGVDSLGRAA